MAGRVHEVQDVGLAVLGLVVEPDGLRLDRDAALALDIHVVEHLLDHFAAFQPARLLDQPVGKRRLAVIDVGDDGKIANQIKRRRHAYPITGLGETRAYHLNPPESKPNDRLPRLVCRRRNRERLLEPIERQFVVTGRPAFQSDDTAVAHAMKRLGDGGIVDLSGSRFAAAGHVGDLDFADERERLAA